MERRYIAQQIGAKPKVFSCERIAEPIVSGVYLPLSVRDDVRIDARDRLDPDVQNAETAFEFAVQNQVVRHRKDNVRAA